MKAAILTGYRKNGCDLVLRDVPVPEVSAQEVLVKVHTAGVNPLDNMIIHGEVKMIVPYRFPLVMGNELVGTIEKVGAGVSGFSVSDRVYGRRSAHLRNSRPSIRVPLRKCLRICLTRKLPAFH